MAELLSNIKQHNTENTETRLRSILKYHRYTSNRGLGQRGLMHHHIDALVKDLLPFIEAEAKGRDILDYALEFSDVYLIPQRSEINSRNDVDLYTNNLTSYCPNTIPIIASNMDTIGCFTMAKELLKYDIMTCLHKYYNVEEYISFYKTLSNKDKNKIFFSIGANDKDFLKLKQVYETCNINNVCIDIAHGYSTILLDYAKKVKELIPNCLLMAGNIAIPEAIEEYNEVGIKIAKVGLGSGTVCSTREKTGVGHPQFSAVIECVKEAKKNKILICSDGGCRKPEDLAKAFGAGASMVMIGGMLSGCEECEAEWEYEYESIKEKDGIPGYTGRQIKKAMKFYGMSSREAMNKHHNGVANYRSVEGKCISVLYKGPVQPIIQDILGGLRSTCTYANAKNLIEFSQKAKFVIIA